MLIGRIILGILLAILLMLAVLLSMTVQVRASYDQGDAELWVRFGPLRFQLYPVKPRGEKKKREPKPPEEPEKPPEKEKGKKRSLSPEQIFYTLETLPPILGRALGRLGRGIRIEPLRIHLLIAGEDPADTALLYGRAQAALAAWMPAVRRRVRIRGEDIRLFLDFQRTRPDCAAEVGISIRCGTAAWISLRAGGSLLKWFLKFRKLAPPAEEKPAERQDAGAA